MKKDLENYNIFQLKTKSQITNKFLKKIYFTKMFDPRDFGDRIMRFDTGEVCYANAVPDISCSEPDRASVRFSGDTTCRVHLYKLHKNKKDIDGVCFEVPTYDGMYAYSSNVPIISIGNVVKYYVGNGASCNFDANGRTINIPIN